jgi:hypothetical protein
MKRQINLLTVSRAATPLGRKQWRQRDRLMQAVRDKEGLTYAIYAGVNNNARDLVPGEECLHKARALTA